MNRKLVAIFWQDHMYVDRGPVPKDPDDVIMTTLSLGIIYKETEKVVVLVNSIEAYEDRDDACYTVILKSTIQATKEFGELEIENLRE